MYVNRTAAPCIVLQLQECVITYDTIPHRSSTPSSFQLNSSDSNDLIHLPSSPPTLSSLSLISLPSAERVTSSEYQINNNNNDMSNDINNNNTNTNTNTNTDRLNWSNLTSPPPPNFLQLPNCPICLRRIINRISHVDDDIEESDIDKLIIGPAFIGHGDRCRVCHIFSDTSSQV